MNGEVHVFHDSPVIPAPNYLGTPYPNASDGSPNRGTDAVLGAWLRSWGALSLANVRAPFSD